MFHHKEVNLRNTSVGLEHLCRVAGLVFHSITSKTIIFQLKEQDLLLTLYRRTHQSVPKTVSVKSEHFRKLLKKTMNS